MPSALPQSPRRWSHAGLCLALLLVSGCAREIVTGAGAQGGATPGLAGGKPGIDADLTVSPNTTSPSRPSIDVTAGQTVTPVGSGPGGGGTPYP